MSDSYINHIIEQIQHNVGFLVAQGHLSHQDAEVIRSRLPGARANDSLVENGCNSVVQRAVPTPPIQKTKSNQVKALWAYNENGQDPNDLSFRPGDLIEIVEETNEDWWTGRVNGKQGLFPSNYVEKIQSDSSAPTAPASQTVGARRLPPPMSTASKAPYKSFGAAHHGLDKPPPPGSGVVNSVGLQEAGGQDKKKSKYGSLGNTMANSAAGGVGFGAGAAIGGGLVRAIF